jgi:PilZ domain-containing protein
MNESQEKRRHPRVRDRLTLHSSCEETGSVDMSTVNLSLGGVQVISDHYMPLMTRVEVVLHLPPEPGPDSRPRPVKAEAVVVRVLPPFPSPESRTFEMALFFSRMEQRDRTALARYLSAHPSEA